MIGTIALHRNIPFIDPYTQSVIDVAEVELKTDDLSNNAWAWNAGFLWKIGAGFSLGGVYRSDFTIKGTSASAEFTQIPTGYPDLDATVAGALPFGENPKVETAIAFPDYWQVGIAWQNEKFTISGQYGIMGWSSFETLDIEFPDYPELNSSTPENYEDSEQIRFGIEWRVSRMWALRAGYVYDETPQPIESLSPLLADGSRDGYSAGLGFTSKKNTWGFDIGYEYLVLEDRSTEGRSFDGFDGTFHDSMAHLAGASFFWKF
jgi:long-chain fatty acid transport protein